MADAGESLFPPDRRAAAKKWARDAVMACWAHPHADETARIGEGVDLVNAALAELDRLTAENDRLRAALAGRGA